MRHNKRTYTKDDLTIGSLIKDLNNSDIGLLIERYNILYDTEFEVWIWDIYWTGVNITLKNMNSPYTESGLLGLLNSGRMIIVEGPQHGTQ